MKKIELSVSKENGCDVIRYELLGNEEYDERVADRLSQLINVIPFQFSDQDGKRILTTYVRETYTLEMLFSKTLQKREVLCLLGELVSIFDIGSQGIPVSYVVKDYNHIYVNEETLRTKCILVPVKQEAIALSEIPEFFRSVISRMSFDEIDMDNYVAKLLTIINSKDFATLKLKQYIDEELEKMGLFISREKGLTSVNAGGAAGQSKDVKVNRLGVMSNMHNSQQRPPMQGQPMMGQPGQMPPQGQPMMGRPGQMPPQGQPMMGRPGQMPPQGQPMMGQPGQMPPQGQPMMGRPGQMPPQGQPMMGRPGQMPPQGQPMMGRPGQMPPQGQPMMGRPGQAPSQGQPMMGQPGQVPPQGQPMMGRPGQVPPQGQPMMGRPGQMPPQGQPNLQTQRIPQTGTQPMMGQPGQMPQQISPQGQPPVGIKPGVPPMMGQVPPQGQPNPQQAPQNQSGLQQIPPQGQPPVGIKPGVSPMMGQVPPQGQPNPQQAPQNQSSPQQAPQNQPNPQQIPPQGQPPVGIKPGVSPMMSQEEEKKTDSPVTEENNAAMPQEEKKVEEIPEAKIAPDDKTIEAKPFVDTQPTEEIKGDITPPIKKEIPEPSMGALVGQLGTKPIPHFVREKTGEIINITKPEFSIGKSESKADYTITDNSAISRVHCIILQKNGVNYIKDNNSTNHTYVNGELLEPDKEVLLKNRTSVRMGDEEFTFLLRKE